MRPILRLLRVANILIMRPSAGLLILCTCMFLEIRNVKQEPCFVIKIQGSTLRNSVKLRYRSASLKVLLKRILNTHKEKKTFILDTDWVFNFTLKNLHFKHLFLKSKYYFCACNNRTYLF